MLQTFVEDCNDYFAGILLLLSCSYSGLFDSVPLFTPGLGV